MTNVTITIHGSIDDPSDDSAVRDLIVALDSLIPYILDNVVINWKDHE